MDMTEAGLDLTAGDVAGQPAHEVWARGICSCGHRIAKHRAGRCLGVPTGRKRLTDGVIESNECMCRTPTPVVMVRDARKFQLSWLVAYPAHPFNVAMRRVEPDQIIAWLVPVPLTCVVCGQGGGVRMVYQPGSLRRVSGLVCQVCETEESRT